MPAKLPITDALRRAIDQSSIPHKALERETGVKRQSIMRFMRGEQSLRLDMADKLASYFGINVSERVALADPPTDILATEFHEAGHAVATAICGVDFGGGDISVEWEARPKEASGRSIAIPQSLSLEDWSVAFLAGPIAEFKCRAALGYHQRTGEPWDKVIRSVRFGRRELLARLVKKLQDVVHRNDVHAAGFGFDQFSFICGGSRRPFEFRVSITCAAPDLEWILRRPVADAQLQQYVRKAAKLLDSPNPWSAVVAIAEALHELPAQKLLPGERAAEIIQAALRKSNRSKVK